MKVEQIIQEREDQIDLGGKIADRRASPRSAVGDAMGGLANHMFEIKRALEAGRIEKAKLLVDGALKIFQSNAAPR